MLMLALVQLLLYGKNRCLLKAFLLSCLGVAFLLILSCEALPEAVSLPLTKGSLCFSFLSGIPGVAALLLGKAALPWL